MAYTIDISGKEVVCADCKEMEKELAGLKKRLRDFDLVYRGNYVANAKRQWFEIMQVIKEEC